jgi:hypothetical protein
MIPYEVAYGADFEDMERRVSGGAGKYPLILSQRSQRSPSVFRTLNPEP